MQKIRTCEFIIASAKSAAMRLKVSTLAKCVLIAPKNERKADAKSKKFASVAESPLKFLSTILSAVFAPETVQ